MKFDEIKSRFVNFLKERDWEKYHTPKNLCISLLIELAELAEFFQWKSDEEIEKIMNNPSEVEKISEELADVFFYLLSLCNTLKIDLLTAAEKKLKKNIEKYPAELVKGKAHKYTYYQKNVNKED